MTSLPLMVTVGRMPLGCLEALASLDSFGSLRGAGDFLIPTSFRAASRAVLGFGSFLGFSVNRGRV